MPDESSPLYCPCCLQRVAADRCPWCRARTYGPGDIDPGEVATLQPPSRRAFGVNQRYRVTKLIGKGGMGAVYKVYDSTRRRLIAGKFLSERILMSEDPRGRVRFTEEIEALAQLESPHIVTFLDYEMTADEEPCLLMELLRGRDLEAWLTQRGQPDPTEIAGILIPVCRALTVAHAEGMVHRDLKPLNVFLHEPGDGSLVVKVVDFGIVRMVSGNRERQDLTDIRLPLGTPEYMAPEQAVGRPVSAATDLYALGAILYRMLAGSVPFAANNRMGVCMQHVNAPVPTIPERLRRPAALVRLAYWLLEKDPANRPASAEAVIKELEPFADPTGRISHVESTLASTAPCSIQTPQVRTAVDVVDPLRRHDSGRADSDPRNQGPTPAAAPAPRHEQTPHSASYEEAAPVPRAKTWEQATPARGRGRKGALVIGAGIAVIVGGVLLFRTFATTAVASVKAHCSEKTGDEVAIKGTVIKGLDIPLTDLSVYKIGDDTDSIWVVSGSSAPPDGARIHLKGIALDVRQAKQYCAQEEGADEEICKVIAEAIQFVAGTCVLLENSR